MRKLSPTRFRYRILDSHGQVITGRSSGDSQDGSQVDCRVDANQSTHHFRDNSHVETVDSRCAEQADYTRVVFADFTRANNSGAMRGDTIDKTCVDSADSTRAHSDHYSTMRCSEAILDGYCRKKTHHHAPTFTYETPPCYGLTA